MVTAADLIFHQANFGRELYHRSLASHLKGLSFPAVPITLTSIVLEALFPVMDGQSLLQRLFQDL
jgi:hypothetical protein